MPGVEFSRRDGARDESNPAGWTQARLGVLVPLGAVVAVAIVCIVVAALTSAQRADDVALKRERQLLTRAVVTHSEWSLRRLKTVLDLKSAVSAGDIDKSEPTTPQRLATWLSALSDHNLVLVESSDDLITYVQTGPDVLDLKLMQAAIPQLKNLVSYLRGQTSLPDGVMRLVDDNSVGTVFMLGLEHRFILVTALPVGRNGKHKPLLVTARVVDADTLANISGRLQLAHLRVLEPGDDAGGDNVHAFTDSRGEPIAVFAWQPQRPGAEILDSVIPFIGTALAGFALLAGLVMRYMRTTAAAIAAGENRLRYLALHDPLCGLPNRNYFGERLEAMIASIRGGGKTGAVFYIDLDHFKDVNDTLGHPIGDELIRDVTLRLSRTMRTDDMVARLGGDEFAVLSTASTDHIELNEIASRIIATVCAPYSIDGQTIVIGASIGIAVIERQVGSDAAADIMRYADMALYRAKNEGRNRACIYDAVMDADLSQRKIVEQELREAIAGDALKVLYQPIFNASGDKIMGVEALARWPHPTRGLVSPGEFIPIAEHSGLIIDLGERVLRRACFDGLGWPNITVSVNVSPLQFRRLDFVSMVERTLAETGFDPARLELELTETTLLGNVDSAENAMRRLKALGVQLALDDFGTGYSSLHYLRRFPFDRLKIDRSFVLSIEKTADAAAIVHAVVSLGRGLGMKVTAEGVETAEQHLFLRAAGVHCMQGFRFGAAMEPAQIAMKLARPGIYRSIEGDAKAALAR